MAHADWIIDLGPGAGHDGGRVVFEGTPADLVKAKSTLTGEHLAEFVEAGLRCWSLTNSRWQAELLLEQGQKHHRLFLLPAATCRWSGHA